MREFTVSSLLSAAPDVLWSHATSPVGVNREFRPLLRMTFPRGTVDVTAGWKPGERQFRSWLLVAGFLPVDYDDLAFAEVEPGRRFLERSALLSQRRWEHERVIEPEGVGCRLTDRVRFVTRLRGIEAVYTPIFSAIFRWRHRNLRREFDGRKA